MATKRPAPDTRPGRPESGINKRRKPNERGGRSFKKNYTVNETKSQIRSLRRLLEHNEDLPADVRIEKERALKTAEFDLRETERAKKRNDTITRWHKIRFFDRQKATKRLKRAKKVLAESTEGGDRETLAREVEECEVDLNYTLYYPLDVSYVSLFPTRQKAQRGQENEEKGAVRGTEQDSNKAQDARQGDPDMREKVKECMRDSSLDALRNGKLTQKPAEDSRGRNKTSKGGRKKAKVKFGSKDDERKTKDEDDDSDGGFFE